MRRRRSRVKSIISALNRIPFPFLTRFPPSQKTSASSFENWRGFFLVVSVVIPGVVSFVILDVISGFDIDALASMATNIFIAIILE